MSGLDEEIAAARERARIAEEQKEAHESAKTELLRDAVRRLRPYGDEVFVELMSVVGAIRRLRAEYEDVEGQRFRALSRHRCWLVDGGRVLLENMRFGEIQRPHCSVRHRAPRLPYDEVYAILPPRCYEHEPSLDELTQLLAETCRQYEDAGRRWPENVTL